jgi:hypothetical protein
VSYVEELVNLRKEIDYIDVKIVEKLADWIQTYKRTVGADSDAFMAQLQGLALEHDLEVEGLKRVFHAITTLADEGRVG